MNIRRILTNIGILCLVSLLMILGLEIVLNIFPQFSFYYVYPTGLFQNTDSPLDFELAPGFSGTMIGEYVTPITINSQGLRDYEHTKQKNTFRILGLGDSFTFGDGVEINKTFLSLLEQATNSEIIKAGVPAYGQDNQLEYYKTKGIEYNPDLVVVFFFQNDISDNNGETDRKVFDGSLIQKYRYESLSPLQLKAYTTLYKSETMRLLKRAATNIQNTVKKPDKTKYTEYKIFLKNQTLTSQEWQKTTMLFGQFKDTVQNAQLVVVYIPSAKQIYPQEYDHFFDQKTDPDKPNNILREITLNEEIAYIDVTKEMRDAQVEDLYYEHDGHLNEKGHKLFASLVGKELYKFIPENLS